jgi:4-diphosphocytidyl-2-C-methyl-D-erythritol kinase
MQQPITVSINAFAKINLGLQILGKRHDGYHDIETILHRVDIYDVIEVRQNTSGGITVQCNHPDVPADSSNLCYKAAELFYSEIGEKPHLSIGIEKNIPIGAGFGGGSSDAAAVLLACNMLLGYPLGKETLRQIASRIGSDVPYFLHHGTAYATGRGDILEYFDLELPYWIVLVYPNIHIDTAWAYRAYAPNRSTKRIQLRSIVSDNLMRPGVWVNSLRNDFEPVVFREHSVIMRVKEALVKAGADFALMSGSGSSVFGLYQDEKYAKEIADSLSNTYPVWLTRPFFSPDSTIIERKIHA